MLGSNIDFVTICIFFFSSEWIAWYIYKKTFASIAMIAVIVENEDHIATISQCSQTEIPSDNDVSFCTEEEISSEEEEEVQIENERPKRSAFIVYWSCLSILVRLIYAAPSIITKVISTGSALCINLLCQENHKCIWRSQPIYLGNVRLSACVHFSSNTYRKLENYFHILNIPWVWKSCYYDMFDHMLVLRNKLGRQNSYK